jgi:hypothetical protein
MIGEDCSVICDYKSITVPSGMESVCVDSLPNFGWKLDEITPALSSKGISIVTLKFRRERNIRNKIELTKLEHQFEDYIQEIKYLQKAKTNTAHFAVFTCGILGIVFMMGFFMYRVIILPLMIILAMLIFLCWIFLCFCYKIIIVKRTKTIYKLIDKRYDDIYEKVHSFFSV